MYRLHTLATHVLLATLSLGAPAMAQPHHAHTHGSLQLDAAVDERTITVQLEAPLDSLLGFERAPRTAAERQRVADLATRLRATGQWLRPDPVAQCAAGRVDLQSTVLGLGSAGTEQAQGGHADLDITVSFRCARAVDARYLDVDLFAAFAGITTIQAQVAAPQGQYKRTLTRKAPRLAWGN